MQGSRDPNPIFRFLHQAFNEPLPWGEERKYIQERVRIVCFLIVFTAVGLLIALLLLDKQKNVTPFGLHREVKSYSQSLTDIPMDSSIQVLPQSQSLTGQQSVFSLVRRSVCFGKQEWNAIHAGNVTNVNHMARQVDQFSKTIFGNTNKQMRLEFPAQHSAGVFCYSRSRFPSTQSNQQGNQGYGISQGHGLSLAPCLNSRGSRAQEGM
jgi:hypothetical protein